MSAAHVYSIPSTRLRRRLLRYLDGQAKVPSRPGGRTTLSRRRANEGQRPWRRTAIAPYEGRSKPAATACRHQSVHLASRLVSLCRHPKRSATSRGGMRNNCRREYACRRVAATCRCAFPSRTDTREVRSGWVLISVQTVSYSSNARCSLEFQGLTRPVIG